MSGDEARVVFDPELLDGSASELTAAYPLEDLLAVLASGMLDEQAFGDVPGASGAHSRVQQAFERTLSETQRTGVDVHQLATDAMTAAQQARDAEAETLRLAREVVLGRELVQLIADTVRISTPGGAN